MYCVYILIFINNFIMHLVKVLFKAISRGERCKFNHYIACDITLEDEVIPEMPVNNGAYKLPAHTLSKWEKADSWVSEQNNVLRNIIDSNDLDCILNWEIIAIDDTHRKPKKEFPKSVQLHESELDKMANILKRTAVGGFSEEFKRNYLYCYLKLQPTLINIPISQKIEIILASMGLGIDAASNAYKNILDVLKLDEKQ